MCVVIFHQFLSHKTGISEKWDPRHRIVGGAQDSRPISLVPIKTQDPEPISHMGPWALKVEPGTQNSGHWKSTFRNVSQFSLKPGHYEWIHVLYAFFPILQDSHYPVIQYIYFLSFIISMSYSFSVVAKASTIQLLWNLWIS